MPKQRYMILRGSLTRRETIDGLPVPPHPVGVRQKRYGPGDIVFMTPAAASTFGLDYLMHLAEEEYGEPSAAPASTPEPDLGGDLEEGQQFQLVQLAPTVVPYWTGNLIYTETFVWPGEHGGTLPALVTGGEARFLGGAWGSQGTVRWNTQLRTAPPAHGEQKTVVAILGDDILAEWELSRAAHP